MFEEKNSKSSIKNNKNVNLKINTKNEENKI